MGADLSQHTLMMHRCVCGCFYCFG